MNDTFNIQYADYLPNSNLLENKTILITGAGSGIGRCAALSYAKHHAQLILLSKTQKNLEDLYDEIVESFPNTPKPILCQIDLLNAQEENYETLINSLEEEFDHLDGLLHNASILGELSEIENQSSGIWDQVMQVNLKSNFLLTKACLPLLKRAPSASLLFTTSSVGRKGRAFWGAYGVSKFATEGLMQTLAEELENTSEVRVNCINPGGTQTKMRFTAFPAEDPNTIPKPIDIMNTYLYLMGDDSQTINGQSIDARLK